MGARERVLQQYGDRLSRLVQQTRGLDPVNGVPVQYAGVGEIKLLGAAGGIPVRGNIGTGGLAIGQPVARSQGIVAGTPNAVQQQELRTEIGRVMALVDATRKVLGIQVGEGDPNDNPSYARYPYDNFFSTDDETFYYWQPGTASAPGEWLPMGGGGTKLLTILGDPNSNETPWQAKTIVADLGTGRTLVSNPDGDPDGAGETPKWLPISTVTFDSSSLSNAEGVYPGDLYQADDGAMYRLNGSGSWVVQWYCPDCTSDPSSGPSDPESGLSAYFIQDGVQYFWDNAKGACANCD
jgi:hypothetical protein